VGPDIVAALGHQTPETYLLTKEAEAQEKLKLYEPK
jgi:hypothetical protein